MTIGTKKSRKMTVPERSRRESSTTALKAAAETRELSYLHLRRRSDEAEVLKTKDRKGSGTQYPRSAPGSVEDCKELWCDGKQ